MLSRLLLARDADSSRLISQDLSAKAVKAYHILVDQQLELLQVEANRDHVSMLSEAEQENEEIAGRAFQAGSSRLSTLPFSALSLSLALWS